MARFIITAEVETDEDQEYAYDMNEMANLVEDALRAPGWVRDVEVTVAAHRGAETLPPRSGVGSQTSTRPPTSARPGRSR